MEQYEELAEVYDLILPDSKGWLKQYSAFIHCLLAPRNVRTVLDCACGTGIPSIGLARLGYNVTASDLSEAMVHRAKEKAKAMGVCLRSGVADMTRLSETFHQRFDCVICAGNSISHLENTYEKPTALRSIRNVLDDGGVFYFDLRDWETILRERQRFFVRAVHHKEQRHFIVLDVWDYYEEKTVFNIILVSELEGDFQTRTYPLTCYPVTKAAMTDLLAQSGFADIEVHHGPQIGYHYFTAIAAKKG